MGNSGFFRAGAAAALLMAAPGNAAVTISTTADVAAGFAGFGPATPLIVWDNLGAGTTDPATGASVAGSIFVTNWINGAGFGDAATPAADLAINGPENFTLSFATAVSRVGFAVSTGLGLLPNEVSNASTSFTLRTSNGDTAGLTLTDPGNGLAIWADVQSTTPFTSLQFTENSNEITDQYFGNVFAGQLPAVGAVPEIATWAMLVAGFGFAGVALRRQPVAKPRVRAH